MIFLTIRDYGKTNPIPPEDYVLRMSYKLVDAFGLFETMSFVVRSHLPRATSFTAESSFSYVKSL